MAEELNAGSIVKDHLWPEPIEIKLLEKAGEYIHITVHRQEIPLSDND